MSFNFKSNLADIIAVFKFLHSSICVCQGEKEHCQEPRHSSGLKPSSCRRQQPLAGGLEGKRGPGVSLKFADDHAHVNCSGNSRMIQNYSSFSGACHGRGVCVSESSQGSAFMAVPGTEVGGLGVEDGMRSAGGWDVAGLAVLSRRGG